jgi:tetratricopeptide (TPR) repeat protein
MSEHELWNELGNLYFKTGTLKQAAYAYRRAIQVDGGFGRPYCNLALTYVKQGRFEEAVQLYQRSIELLVDDTERAITWYRLGDVYRHLKDYRDAILAYQQADMLGADISPEDKETDQILYGGAEVRLVQAGTVAPSIPETVASTGMPVSEAETPAPSPAVDEIAQPEPAAVEIASGPSIQSAEEPQAVAASVDEAPVETVPVDETPAVIEERVAEPAPVQEVAAAVDEVVGDAAPVAEVVEAVEETLVDASPVQEVVAAPVDEVVGDLALVDETLETVDEAVMDAAPVQEASPVEEEVVAPALVDETPETSEEVVSDAALAESEPAPDEIIAEPADFMEAVEPALELQTSEPVTEVSLDEDPETASVATDIETVTVDEIAPAEEPVVELVDEAAVSAADWEEYVVSSMAPELDPQIPDPVEQSLDQWLPEVEIDLPAAETEEPVEEPAVFEQHPEPEAFPASEEGAPFSPQFPAPAAQAFVSEEMLAAVPSLALDFQDGDTQPVFIVPQEIEQGFAVVQVESGTTDVACAVESEELDAEMQGILAEIDRFKHAVQSNPRNAPAWDTLGTLYKAARKYRDAIMAYQQAVSVDPSKPHYHHHLGILYAIEGREEDAMKAFQDVIEIDPNHSLANATLGGYYRKMGLEELAQKHIGKAMKNFYTSENEYNRACLEALCGNIEQSLELLRIALKNKQTYVDWVLRDPDLDSIRRDPRFKQLISDYATW